MSSTQRHGGWAALDPALPEAARELTERLRSASAAAGRPSFRQLRARSARTGTVVLTPTTLHRIFTPDPGRAGGQSLPEWTYYRALLELLDCDPDAWQDHWDRAQREWRARTPATSAEQPVEADAAPARRGPEALQEVSREAEPRPGRAPAARLRGRLLVPLSLAAGVVVVLAGGIAAGVLLTQPRTGVPGPVASPAAQQRHRLPQPDGSDPNATGCAATSRLTTHYSHLYPHWPRQQGPHSAAIVTLDYSPACRTVWVVLRNASPGAVATLHRAGDRPGSLRCTAGADGSCATAQLNDIKAHSYAEARFGRYYARTGGL